MPTNAQPETLACKQNAGPYYVTREGFRRYFHDIADVIAKHHPAQIGKHIFVQLDALGAEVRAEFDNSESPHALPFSFSEYQTSPTENDVAKIIAAPDEPADESEQLETVCEELESAGNSASLAVADHLRTVAANGGEQATIAAAIDECEALIEAAQGAREQLSALKVARA